MKFCWVTIQVKDLEKSLHFYQEIMSLTIKRRMKPNPDMEIVFMGSGETKVELICDAKKEKISMGQDISLGFEVDSIEEISEKLGKNKIPIYSGPFQPSPHSKFIYILDPDGVKIQLVENIMQ